MRDEERSPIYVGLVFLIIVLITMLTMVASTGVVIATPVITGALALSKNLNIWITTGYLIVVASTVPCSIYLAEKFGYKKVFVVATFIYALAGSFIGLTNNFFFFLSFRLLSGVGVGLIFPVSLSILSQTFSAKLLPLILAGYTALGFGLGATFGFYIGGVISQNYSWTWVFFLDAILGVPLGVFAAFLIKEVKGRPLGGFDFVGYILFVVFVCSLVMILANAKASWNTEGWNSWFIKGCVIICILSLVAFLFEENKRKHPLFYLSLFKIQSFTLGCLLLFFVGGMFFSTASLFPLILINVLKYSKIQAAIHMMFYGLSVGVTGGLTGVFLEKIGEKKVLLFGCTCIALDAFFQHSFSIYSDHTYILGLLCMRGIGIGMTMGPITAWAMKEVPQQLRGNGSIIITIFRQLGSGLLGSWMELVAYDRYRYHSDRFFENFEFQTRGYEQTVHKLSKRNFLECGQNWIENKKEAKSLIIDTIDRQAHLLSFNDSFFLLGIIVSFLLTIVIFFFVLDFFRKKTKKIENSF